MQTSSEILDQIHNQCANLRVVRSRAIGIRRELSRLEASLLPSLLGHGGGYDPDHPENNMSAVYGFARSGHMDDIIRLRITLQILEGTEQYAESVKLLDPLHAKLEEAQARDLNHGPTAVS